MKKTALVLLMVLAVGASGVWLGLRMASAPPGSLAVPEKPAKLAAAQSYVCPMHTHIVQDHPGNCPICGMDLVALKDASTAATNQIYVDTATQQKLGVQTAHAEIAELTHDIAAYGTLVADESAVLRIGPSADGVLMRLHVNRPGQRVERGQLLYELSSQEALDLQYEYIDIQGRGASAYKMAEERRAQNRKAIDEAGDPAAREQAVHNMQRSEEQVAAILRPLERDRERIGLRLMQIGFTDAMLDKLARDKQVLKTVPVRAPRACVVKEVIARPGMTVNHMTEILQCIDPSQAQIEIVLYADQLAWVEEGDALTLAFANGETLQTKLTGLHPLVDEATRTLKVRVPLTMKRPPNLGEYAQVTIHTTPRRVLSVPKTAVMRSGRGDFVMQSLGKGHFMPVKVATGIESAERVAIRSGLEPGDEVAVNGQFLLDAAASIADAAQRMRAAQQSAP
jgi:Cu(I)/Ag(I) efflux system membrane fusion protein